MLSVDAQQPGAELPQQRHRGQRAVQIHPAPPARRNYTADEEFFGFQQIMFRKEGGKARAVETEDRLDNGFCGLAANQVGSRPIAQGQAEGLHEQAFARARLSGNHIQAGLERQFEIIDQGQILDVQMTQHRTVSRALLSPAQATPRRDASSRRSLNILAIFRNIRAPIRG